MHEFHYFCIIRIEDTMMFWKMGDSEPLGVRLSDLLLMLQSTSIKANIKGRTLIAQHGGIFSK